VDRIFLAGLVREIASVVCGSRVRSVRIDSDPHAVSLAVSRSSGRHELVLHITPGVAGLYPRELSREYGSASPREAKLRKLLGSSEIVTVEAAELDRVVTIELAETRLTGNKRRRAIVLELVPVRTGAYIVDLDSSRVVEVSATGTPRLALGDRYRPLDPPPHASPPAGDAAELERRIRAAGGGIDRATLLSATGWTPLLVKELRFLIEGGEPIGSAFEALQHRLRNPRPVLYEDPDNPRTVLLSPIELDSESRMRPRVMESFNAAMTEAIRVSVHVEKSIGLRRRLEALVSKRLQKLRALKRKLEAERRRLPEPGVLRQRGETLLAGMGRAERVEDSRVRLPDVFDPEEGWVEIEIDPRLGLSDNAQKMFRRSRKMERKKLELERRLDEIELVLTYLEGVRVSVDDALELEELEAIRRELEDQGLGTREDDRSLSRPRREKKLPPRKIYTRRGSVVLVGRSARSNVELTFDLAKPEDLWFHAAGMPGSHVVLKLGESTEADEHDEEDILEAAGYAAYFSKGRQGSYVEVMVTERKNVSKIKGAPPGLVKVERMRTLRVRPTPPETMEDTAKAPESSDDIIGER